MKLKLFNCEAIDNAANTPLHTALFERRFAIASEIFDEKPALALKQNSTGQNSAHICALQSADPSYLKFVSNAIEQNGNTLLQAKNSDGQNPIELCEALNSNTDTSKKWKSSFGVYFGPFLDSGDYTKYCDRLVTIKMVIVLSVFVFFFCLSVGMSYRYGSMNGFL